MKSTTLLSEIIGTVVQAQSGRTYKIADNNGTPIARPMNFTMHGGASLDYSLGHSLSDLESTDKALKVHDGRYYL